MYSTRLLHKGDPYKDPSGNPFRQSKLPEGKAVWHSTGFPKNAENGNFSKTEYKGGGFKESIRYIESQPPENRKKGFGTKDAFKSDEFTSSIRTEQYRETLRKEMKMTKLDAEAIQSEIDKLMAERESTMKFTAQENTMRRSLYDVGRSRVTEFDPKAKTDSFYKFNETKGKRLGQTEPVSCDVGRGSWDFDYKPSPYGGKSEVKNFFDKSHLTVGLK